jgi:AcrR family transcriptional regulator
VQPSPETGGEVGDFRHGRVPRAVRERQILALAEELFAERGYRGTSMEELARRAGVSKPVIYGLVHSKEELYYRCCQRAADELADAVGRAAAAHVGDLEGMLQAAALAYFHFIDAHRGAFRMLYAEHAGGRHATFIAGVRARQARLLVAILTERAAEAGRPVDRRRLEGAAHALNGGAEALGLWWRDNPDVSAETLSDWLIGVMLPGLQALTEAPAG